MVQSHGVLRGLEEEQRGDEQSPRKLASIVAIGPQNFTLGDHLL